MIRLIKISLFSLAIGLATNASAEALCGGASQLPMLQLCTDGVQFAEGFSEQNLACKAVSRWSKKRRSWLLAKKPAKQWSGIAGGRAATFEHIVTVGSACRMVFKYHIAEATKANGRKQAAETGHLVGRVHNNVFVGHIEQDNFDRQGVFSLLLDDSGQVFTGSVYLAKRGSRQLGSAQNWTGGRD